MNFYVYQADVWCEDCGRDIRRRIRKEGNAPENPRDESSYDSDEYPKGPYPGDQEESDSPRHCGSGEECLNAIELSDGRKIGAWLDNPLTSHGLLYVACAVRDNPDNEVSQLWAEWYSDALRELEGGENDD